MLNKRNERARSRSNARCRSRAGVSCRPQGPGGANDQTGELDEKTFPFFDPADTSWGECIPGATDVLLNIKGERMVSLNWLTRQVFSCPSSKHFEAVYQAIGDQNQMLRDYGCRVPKNLAVLEKRISQFVGFLHNHGPVEEALAELLRVNEQASDGQPAETQSR